ncbi:hypothetical protein I3843_03G119300 [Carya illinoinensis]|nr:hypothetical protein I3843_03G119300 [Carya illinoinensis]
MYLSKGGRLTLIKSTLTNLPTYFLSLFPLPAGVGNKIEKLFRAFLWGGMGEEKKFHRVRWKTVCDPVVQGGLGVCDLRTFNKALLGKWLWRYQSEGDALWKEIIVARHGDTWGGWCSNEGRGGYGVGLWKFIRRGWSCFENHIRFVVGEGNRISFWRDVWCGEHALEKAFLNLYRIVANREASVADMRSLYNGTFQWDVLFNRDFHN